MATDPEIIKELSAHMQSLGWSRPKAEAQAQWWVEFIAPRVREEQAAQHVAQALLAGPGEDETPELSGLLQDRLRAAAGAFVADEQDTSAGCVKCPQSALYNLLGHDQLGHRTTNALTTMGIKTPAQLVERGAEEVLDYSRVGRQGLDRINERLGPEASARFMSRRY